MGAIELELRCCPQKVNDIGIDPEPNWSFDSLLSELNTLENKLTSSSSSSSSVPLPFIKAQSREFSNRKGVEKRSPMAFVMSLSDEDIQISESESDEENHDHLGLVTAKRFNCNDLYTSESDDSDYESDFDAQSYLLDKVGLVESAIFELSREHNLQIQEDIRNQLSALEMKLMSEHEKSASAMARIEKYREARRELERKLDAQYQRKIAEALDNHLTAIQRDHELKSQIEERRIRSDAAQEEAKRKERALQEERLRQERARAEAEAEGKRRAEEAKMAALEAERKAAKEASEREAAEASKKTTSILTQSDGAGPQVNGGSSNVNLQSQETKTKKSHTTVDDIVRATQSALKLEQGRLQKLKEVEEANKTLILSSNMDFSNHERHIGRLIRQIGGIEENVRKKAIELVGILKNPSCPQSISVAAFAKKVVSRCKSPDNAAFFARGHVIVHFTSQVPQAMDLLLAELHKACIYTVPKHIVYSKSVFESEEAYYKHIGYQEDEGKIESVEDYLKRLEAYMKLYGALVQTQVHGVQNIHGPKEGWAWLARFLNSLPANKYTAVALNAFLQTAGFVLFKKYKSQFIKLLNIISNDFLGALRKQKDSELIPIIQEIQSYIEDNKFCQEPEGRRLQGQLKSRDFQG